MVGYTAAELAMLSRWRSLKTSKVGERDSWDVTACRMGLRVIVMSIAKKCTLKIKTKF